MSKLNYKGTTVILLTIKIINMTCSFHAGNKKLDIAILSVGAASLANVLVDNAIPTYVEGIVVGGPAVLGAGGDGSACSS